MIIRSSQVALTATHARTVEQTRVEQLRLWSGRQAATGSTPPAGSTAQAGSVGSTTGARPAAPAVPAIPAVPARGTGSPATPAIPAVPAAPASRVRTRAPSAPVHEPRLHVPPGHSGHSRRAADAQEDLVTTGKLGILISLIERLTGREVQVLDPSDLRTTQDAGAAVEVRQPPVAGDGRTQAPDGGVGWGMDYRRTETTVEREDTTFTAEARVTTADGRQLDIDVDLGLHRESVETTETRILAGDAARPQVTDPLVLSTGRAPSLSAETVDVDLDGDGAAETVSFVGPGSAFLALDRNGNGRVDDGSELFGPTSGDGFAELAAFDDDGNGWIDEADAVYARLSLWSAASGPLASLAEAGVGAIGLTNVATPFEFSVGGETRGLLRSSGIWLSEDGAAGTVHQIDLAT